MFSLRSSIRWLALPAGAFALAALLVAGGHSRASAGALPPPDWNPGPEPTPDDICSWGLCGPVVHPVLIDVMPGNDLNCFVNDGHGVIPVAILGSATFDVSLVSLPSVRLSSLAVNAVGNGNTYLATYRDVNGDGFTDLVVQIEDGDGVFTTGWSWASLTAALNDGSFAVGSDLICILQ